MKRYNKNRVRFAIKENNIGGAAASASAAAPALDTVAPDLGSLAPGGLGKQLDTQAALGGASQGLQAATTYGLGGVTNLQLDPLAGTGTDPLANGVGTQVADFKPVGTTDLTGPVTSGASLAELPVAGDVVHTLGIGG
ncbi:hypothetical protein [Streptomyces sp. SPB074]|uniref:hypothetical protein n=1 Tax=Streptomyces sp. (strain SPB074) TaxID=465543 RepID=UPI0006813BE5|nr:hypothetical protein [Streptomyces sp. SPB074]